MGGESMTSILSGDSRRGAWNCANCWKCIEFCPVGVDIYRAIIDHRRGEPAPASYREAYGNVRRHGYIFPMEEIDRIREMWGLRRVRLIEPEKLRLLIGPGGD